MKRSILITLSVLLAAPLFAQNKIAQLEGINYQAVAIDHEVHQLAGEDITNKPLFQREIAVRFTIDDGPSGSQLHYSDAHVVTTDKYGMFHLVIGKGVVESGSAYSRLLDIPWINGDQWLKVEISIHNDGNFREVSYQKFMAVPFAFYSDDIADNSITTYKVVDEALQAVDIDTGAVTTSEILDETILAEDIATGAVETSEILNETILAEDIATGAVETSEILNGTILNEDVADGTLDLTTKVTNILPLPNGGTGVDSLDPGAVIIGNGTGPVATVPKATDSSMLWSAAGMDPVWQKITAGEGISISYSNDSIIFANTITGGVTANGNQTINVNNISPGNTYTSPAFPVPGNGQLGDIILGSIDKNLQGCMLTAYFTTGNTAKIAIFNGTNSNVNLGQVTVKLLVVQ